MCELRHTGVAAALVLLLTAEMALPRPEITPGAIWTTSAVRACERPLPPRPEHRLWYRFKWARMMAYGIPWSERRNYELDHLIPRCAGGADVLGNLWPQPWVDAVVKDRDEEKLCRILCDDPSDERLRGVQDYFRSNGWAK